MFGGFYEWQIDSYFWGFGRVKFLVKVGAKYSFDVSYCQSECGFHN